jgi:hypothetical protein
MLTEIGLLEDVIAARLSLAGAWGQRPRPHGGEGEGLACELEQYVEQLRGDPFADIDQVLVISGYAYTGFCCLCSPTLQIWCTTNLEPLYIIHPCDDTAGDIYSLAWDHREGGTLYFGM